MAYIKKRTSKNGKAHFLATVRVSGFPTRCATFEKYGEARDWARGIEADMRAGRYGGNIVAQKYTVREMIQRYMDNVLEIKSTKKQYIEGQRSQLEWWKSRIGDCRLSNLTPFIINDCKDELAGKHYSKRKPATINRYLAALNHVINTAKKQWGWISTNPMQDIVKPRESRGRVRFLADKERMALLPACEQEKKKPLYLIVVFALCTGARKNEILTLLRKDVDIERQVAVAYNTKNGDPRQLYLWDHLCILLKEWMDSTTHIKSSYLFPNKSGTAPINIESEWRRALRIAGVKDFRFHDLRHSAASYMAMNGASPSDIAEALGHKSLHLVKRYAHLSTTHVGNVVRSMNEKIFGQQ